MATGPTGPATTPFIYFLPTGLTGVGTLAQVVAFLLNVHQFPTSDPGVTGQVWGNSGVAQVSKGS